ncbi:uncharacterized protein LOC111271347 [Varroa jacobsoni]|uniref:Uncharacterized protein n=1 Tax=Varroa destructor TaxID=109461 RepID=A0A7M7K8Y9_VARDE|nr:uncharacterized protein LOC111251198 [Varroa destructor]XP_022707817.1 uncharacterized protein LOC111271347 [Varroa jacobsoni]XP_022707818.1 uncharacterized protein LOC111271347 [Varroa jacobsoni]XP_022707819.1 uncharacterized protein LOC111271347 [Varroa jacobsoni]
MCRTANNINTNCSGAMSTALLTVALVIAVCAVGTFGKLDAESPPSAPSPVEYPPQYFDAPLEAEYVLLKKADVPPAPWNRLYNDWGKRADNWKNLNHLWGKRSATLPTRWDKRPQPQWNELSGYWGKRSAQ